MSNKENLSFTEGLEVVIQSGLELIPSIGGAISTAYFGTKQAKEFKRIERLYSELSCELSAMKSKIVSIENQYEDGLVSLIEQVNDKVEKEHQESKFQLYKKFMKNILIDPVTTTNYDKRKNFLDILDSMSILECEVLGFLYNNRTGFVKVGTINKPGVEQYALVGAINKLKSYGFLVTAQANLTIGGTDDNLLSENILISDYGVEFVKFTFELQ